jgi:hypothetical protein
VEVDKFRTVQPFMCGNIIENIRKLVLHLPRAKSCMLLNVLGPQRS